MSLLKFKHRFHGKSVPALPMLADLTTGQPVILYRRNGHLQTIYIILLLYGFYRCQKLYIMASIDYYLMGLKFRL